MAIPLFLDEAFFSAVRDNDFLKKKKKGKLRIIRKFTVMCSVAYEQIFSEPSTAYCATAWERGNFGQESQSIFFLLSVGC